MKVKLRDLFAAKDVFAKVFNEPIDIKLAYRFGKISKKINSEIEDIDKQRISLIGKYADEQTEDDIKKGKPKQVKEKLDKFMEEFNALLDVEENIDIQLIPFGLLLSSGIKLSTNELNAISQFIEEDKNG